MALRTTPSGSIQVYRPQSVTSDTTRIVLRDGFGSTLVIVIPDGEIIDTLSQQLILSNLLTKDLDIAAQLQDVEF